jgi:hypothetical protein
VTAAESRVLALLADGEWHDETEIRTSRAMLERLWLAGAIQGAMDGLGAYPEHRLWRLGRLKRPTAGKIDREAFLASIPETPVAVAPCEAWDATPPEA